MFNGSKRYARNMSRSDKRNNILHITYCAGTAASRGDNRSLYRLARKLGPFKPKAVKTVCKECGSTTMSSNEYDDVWFRYFKALVRAEDVNSVEDIVVEHVGSCRTAPPCNITWERVQDALSSLKLGKAVGPDGISAELIRAGGPEFT